MKPSIAIPCSTMWTFRRVKSPYLCGFERAETGWVIQDPSELQKCCSIVPRNIEKAGKKFLTSYPLFCCNPLWQLPCFSWLLILFYEYLPFGARFFCNSSNIVELPSFPSDFLSHGHQLVFCQIQRLGNMGCGAAIPEHAEQFLFLYG